MHLFENIFTTAIGDDLVLNTLLYEDKTTKMTSKNASFSFMNSYQFLYDANLNKGLTRVYTFFILKSSQKEEILLNVIIYNR